MAKILYFSELERILRSPLNLEASIAKITAFAFLLFNKGNLLILYINKMNTMKANPKRSGPLANI